MVIMMSGDNKEISSRKKVFFLGDRLFHKIIDCSPIGSPIGTRFIFMAPFAQVHECKADPAENFIVISADFGSGKDALVPIGLMYDSVCNLNQHLVEFGAIYVCPCIAHQA